MLLVPVARTAEAPVRGYQFRGPEIRRISAEQFSDAIGSITGEWSISRLNVPAPLDREAAAKQAATAVQPTAAARGAARGAGGQPAAPARLSTEATSAGRYVREWRMPSTRLTRALGRPVRDQVTSVRAVQATTPQALEMVNGELLNAWLVAGARRLLGQERPAPPSLYNRAVAGRNARPVPFSVNIGHRSGLWLVVQEQGSNDPERVLPVWQDAELVDAAGAATPLSSLTPVTSDGFRPGGAAGPPASGAAAAATAPTGDVVRVRNPSVLQYDISGRGFTEFRGVMWLENGRADIGATLDPQVRFFVFGEAPNLDRLVPPLAGTPLPAPPVLTTTAAVVDRVFRHALGRAPTADERRLAEDALRDPADPTRPSADGVASLLWALLMKPEFQFIH